MLPPPQHSHGSQRFELNRTRLKDACDAAGLAARTFDNSCASHIGNELQRIHRRHLNNPGIGRFLWVRSS